MFELKFTPKIKEIKELICSWSRKILSTAERITVVKSLILPKITHLLISLPNPPKEKLKEIENIFMATSGILKLQELPKVILFKAKKMEVFK